MLHTMLKIQRGKTQIHKRDRDRAALSVLVGERSPDHICLSFKTGKNMEEQVETHYFLSNGQ